MRGKCPDFQIGQVVSDGVEQIRFMLVADSPELHGPFFFQWLLFCPWWMVMLFCGFFGVDPVFLFNEAYIPGPLLAPPVSITLQIAPEYKPH